MTTKELEEELAKLMALRTKKTALLEESKEMRKLFCANRFHNEITILSQQIEDIQSQLSCDPNQMSLF